MWTLARKILVHDRIKFAVAAAGVSVSVWLVLVQVGMYLGFMENASNLIDNSRADIWVASDGNDNFDFSVSMDERHYYRVAQLPGVARVERLIVAFGQFKLSTGGAQSVEVVGLQRDATLLYPWNIVDGSARRMSEVGAVVIDRGEFDKLQIRGLGDTAEIFDARLHVVGVTAGLRSFTTSPYIFTNIESARAFTFLSNEQVTYLLVQAEPGTDIANLTARIDALPDIEAYDRAHFSERSRTYWSQRTGIGTGFFMTAIMGVVVGLVVVGQILYNGTLEHLKEYGTLKAMGAPNAAIVKTILYQALISAIIGYVLGTGLAFLSRIGVRAANVNLLLPPSLLVGTAVLTATMCGLASLLSVHKVLHLDPASVFKG